MLQTADQSFDAQQYIKGNNKKKKSLSSTVVLVPGDVRMFACSSVCNCPLLDRGVVGGGDQSVRIYPGKAADVMQTMSIWKLDPLV